MASKKPNLVYLSNGETMTLASIRSLVPSTVRCLQEHVLLCERVAKLAATDPVEFPVYVNHLVIHSNVLLQFSSLLFLIRTGEIDANKVVIDFELPANIDDLGGGDLVVEYSRKQPRRNYLRNGLFVSFFFKFCAHRLYRLLRRRLSPSDKLIRAYVDTTIRSYEGVVSESNVFVYPFKTNFFRQVEFLRHCRRRQLPATRMGLPYRIMAMFGLLWKFNRRDMQLVRIEIAVHRAHAIEIEKLGFKEVLSDSESETVGCVLNQELRNRDIVTVNTCHGVGVYGPYIDFEHCVFFNPIQKEFYDNRAHIRHFYYRRSAKLDEITQGPTKDLGPVQIVLLQGNWENAGKLYEMEFEARVSHELKRIAVELDIPFVIKVHPNTNAAQIQGIEQEFGVPAKKQLDRLGKRRFIFVNTLSTAYYSFLNCGPILFARDQLLDPTLVFGDSICTVYVDDLASKIGSMLLEFEYANSLKLQIQNEMREPVFEKYLGE